MSRQVVLAPFALLCLVLDFASPRTGMAAHVAPPMPCATNEQARRFDFWLGQWSVTSANATTIVGHSRVEKVSGGCALLENWTASNGNEGKSLNAYDPQLKHWRQFWVGQDGGVTDYRDSHWDGATLVFLATTNAGGENAQQRLSFAPVDERTVRQTGESSRDGGRTWHVDYDFLYHRQ